MFLCFCCDCLPRYFLYCLTCPLVHPNVNVSSKKKVYSDYNWAPLAQSRPGRQEHHRFPQPEHRRFPRPEHHRFPQPGHHQPDVLGNTSRTRSFFRMDGTVVSVPCGVRLSGSVLNRRVGSYCRWKLPCLRTIHRNLLWRSPQKKSRFFFS